MRLFLSHLRFSRGALIAWGLVVLAYAFLVPYLYDMVGVQGQELFKIYEAFPKQMLAAVGLSGETELKPGLEAYLAIEYLGWLPLLLGIYALFYGSGLVSREVERGTLELLLSFPISRRRVVLTKFLVFSLIASVLTAASIAGLLIAMPVTGEGVNLANLLLVHLLAYLLVIAIASYSTLASCLYLSPRKSLTAAGLFTAASYILNFMSPSLGSLEWLKKLSLFYYYQPLPTLLRGEVNWAGVLIYLAVSGAALLTALAVFRAKDILPE